VVKALLGFALVAILTAITRTAAAHVGSPDVFYEGDAGPYHLFVTVRVPQVIPGIAEVEIRTRSGNVQEITSAVARLTGAGSKYLPVPDLAKQSVTDPRSFTASLWLMEYGSLRVLLNVRGSLGSAQLSVPVPSFGQTVLPMPRTLGVLLLVLMLGLAVGAIVIVGAAAREARITPGVALSSEYRRRGFRAMGIMSVIIVLIGWGGFSWWNVDAEAYAKLAHFFKLPKCAASIIGNELVIRPADRLWLENERVEDLVPDHGHIMHLFLVRTPGLDRLWHLHPLRTDHGTFEVRLPTIEGGHYAVFADIVDKYGFPWTLVGAIDLPAVSGQALGGDDSEGTAVSIKQAADTNTSVLADGTRVIWKRDATPLKAKVPIILKFEVLDKSGSPAADLEPYMGMSAHAEVLHDDLSVFAHVHPSGSASMAAMMMASSDLPTEASMVDMKMPTEKLPPELSIPYGFPKPGLYRIFLQFRRAGRIETAYFDTHID